MSVYLLFVRACVRACRSSRWNICWIWWMLNWQTASHLLVQRSAVADELAWLLQLTSNVSRDIDRDVIDRLCNHHSSSSSSSSSAAAAAAALSCSYTVSVSQTGWRLYHYPRSARSHCCTSTCCQGDRQLVLSVEFIHCLCVCLSVCLSVLRTTQSPVLIMTSFRQACV